MIRAALLCLIAAPAAAFDMPPFKGRMETIGTQGNCFEVIQIENRNGGYNNTEHLQTVLGVVSVKYTTHGGHNAIDDDEVEVVALPNGVLADPAHMMLPDDETGRICLKFWGG